MNEQELVALLGELERIRELRVRYESLLLALDEYTPGSGFVSLAEEVFVPGKSENEVFLTHIGADIMLELSRDDAKAFFSRRVEKLREAEVLLLRMIQGNGQEG